MMTQEEALKWVATMFEQPVDQLTPETPRDDIPMWDSLGVLMLMADYDEKFGIVLTGDDMRGMRKVDDILEVLRKAGKLQKAVA
jgi:acyl carrier protein